MIIRPYTKGILHCNTPYAGLLGANPRIWNEGTKAINISHFEGGSKLNSQTNLRLVNAFTVKLIMFVIVQSQVPLLLISVSELQALMAFPKLCMHVYLGFMTQLKRPAQM